jgi:proteic killer suppression protein
LIKSFKHRGLEKFYLTDSKAGIQPAHAVKLRRQLTELSLAQKPPDVDVPGWDLHPLKGELTGHWSIKVNGNWRLTFRFAEQDIEVVDYLDYH